MNKNLSQIFSIVQNSVLYTVKAVGKENLPLILVASRQDIHIEENLATSLCFCLHLYVSLYATLLQ
jgi:hypothetical protein